MFKMMSGLSNLSK